jgi:hypothetical protein
MPWSEEPSAGAWGAERIGLGDEGSGAEGAAVAGKRYGPNNEYQLRRRANSDRWYVQWYERASGQTQYKSLGVRGFPEAEAALAAFIARRHQTLGEPSNYRSIEEVFEFYWDKHGQKIVGKSSQKLALGYWLMVLDESLMVAEIRVATIDRLVAKLRSYGHSESYISKTLAAGRAAFRLHSGAINAVLPRAGADSRTST